MIEALREFYNRDSGYLLIHPDGQVEDSPVRSFRFLDIVPGSFNPLHAGHRFIYDSIDYSEYNARHPSQRTEKMFEVSIERCGKPAYTFEELYKVISQFQWYAPVLVTRAGSFREKNALLMHAFGSAEETCFTYHVGVDTADRLIQMDRDVVLSQDDEVWDEPFRFVVYPRRTPGHPTTTLIDILRKHNLVENGEWYEMNETLLFPPIVETPEHLLEANSTAIRNGVK